MSIFSFLKNKKNNETTKEFIARLPYNPEVDPIAEASIYLAYGRTEQAKEILLTAQETDPDNKEITDLLEKIENDKESIKINTANFSAPKMLKNKYFLISLMVQEKNTEKSYPENFKLMCPFIKDTKEWQEYLFKEIEKKDYASWALLSSIELKD